MENDMVVEEPPVGSIWTLFLSMSLWGGTNGTAEHLDPKSSQFSDLSSSSRGRVLPSEILLSPILFDWQYFLVWYQP
jgi:hypothetical protein